MKSKPTDLPRFTVYVVEDDEAIRISLQAMLESVGYVVELFAEARPFLDAYQAAPSQFRGCMVLDVRMPGMSGLELQRKLKQLQAILPIIFVTGHGDIPMAVEAVEQGAVGFLTKPYRDQDLLDKIAQARDALESRWAQWEENRDFNQSLMSLTSREREILDRIINGQASKVIAIELNISERTVEVHRGNLFKKLKTRSLTETTRKYLAVVQNNTKA